MPVCALCAREPRALVRLAAEEALEGIGPSKGEAVLSPSLIACATCGDRVCQLHRFRCIACNDVLCARHTATTDHRKHPCTIHGQVVGAAVSGSTQSQQDVSVSSPEVALQSRKRRFAEAMCQADPEATVCVGGIPYDAWSSHIGGRKVVNGMTDEKYVEKNFEGAGPIRKICFLTVNG